MQQVILRPSLLTHSANTQVDNCSIELPGKAAVDVAQCRRATTTLPDGGAATPSAPAITIMDIGPSDLEVVTPVPGSANDVVDVASLNDTTPPVITLNAEAFMPLLELDAFIDPGVSVYDNLDGNSISATVRIQLCARPAVDLSTVDAGDGIPLSGFGPRLADINTSTVLLDDQVYVFTYSARDLAGNQATPVRRYVSVAAR